MTAEKARKLRYSKEDEKVGHKNTFNLLVSDYINQIDSKIKDERSKIMIQETEKSRVEFMDSQVGLIESVLVERKREGGYFEGYTKNYTPVHIFTNKDIAGEIVNVKITSVENDYCIGELN